MEAIAPPRASRAEAMLEVGTPLGHEYLETRHPQQDEVHLRALTFDYLYGWAQFTRAWADSAFAEVALGRHVALTREGAPRAGAHPRPPGRRLAARLVGADLRLDEPDQVPERDVRVHEVQAPRSGRRRR